MAHLLTPSCVAPKPVKGNGYSIRTSCQREWVQYQNQFLFPKYTVTLQNTPKVFLLSATIYDDIRCKVSDPFHPTEKNLFSPFFSFLILPLFIIIVFLCVLYWCFPSFFPYFRIFFPLCLLFVPSFIFHSFLNISFPCFVPFLFFFSLIHINSPIDFFISLPFFLLLLLLFYPMSAFSLDAISNVNFT